MEPRLTFDLAHESLVAFRGMAVDRHRMDDERFRDPESVHFGDEFGRRGRLPQRRVDRTPPEDAIGIEKPGHGVILAGSGLLSTFPA